MKSYFNSLEYLQAWYASHCDGGWKHDHEWGIEITNMTDPGWLVKINLCLTGLEDEPMSEINIGSDSPEYLRCWVAEEERNGKTYWVFNGMGGAH